MRIFKFTIIFLFVLLSFKSYSQQETAYVDTVEAIVIHEYLKIDYGMYCLGYSFLLLGQDTLLFYGDAGYNEIFIRENPSLIPILGSKSNYWYDRFVDRINNNYKYNLSFSKYNSLKNPELRSNSLYFNEKTKNAYSIYNFCGVVNVYVETKNRQIVYDGDGDEDCPCYSFNYDIKTERFMVLRETLELKPLTKEQISDLQVTKSNEDILHIFFCE